VLSLSSHNLFWRIQNALVAESYALFRSIAGQLTWRLTWKSPRYWKSNSWALKPLINHDTARERTMAARIYRPTTSRQCRVFSRLTIAGQMSKKNVPTRPALSFSLSRSLSLSLSLSAIGCDTKDANYTDIPSSRVPSDPPLTSAEVSLVRPICRAQNGPGVPKGVLMDLYPHPAKNCQIRLIIDSEYVASLINVNMWL